MEHFDRSPRNPKNGVKGNAARLINHSCEPNCVLLSIRVENQSPRIAIFAKTNIDPGDELSYNYGDCNSTLVYKLFIFLLVTETHILGRNQMLLREQNVSRISSMR